jgi:hypothetical protein
MIKIRNKILQKVGDFILNQMELCSKEDLNLWYNRGIWFDSFCIYNFDLYLD